MPARRYLVNAARSMGYGLPKQRLISASKRSPVSGQPCYCSVVIKKTLDKRKPTTHFDQVPLDVVKRIVGVGQPAKSAPKRSSNLIVERTKKTEPYRMPALRPDGSSVKSSVTEWLR